MKSSWIEYFLIGLMVWICLFEWREVLPETYIQQSTANALFVSAQPLLKGVHKAGFYIESQKLPLETNTHFAWLYQWAQFAVSPTILDYESPFSYDYVIVGIKGGDWETIKQHFPWRKREALGHNFFMLIR